MKDKLDTLLEGRVRKYYSRLVKAFVKDFSKVRDKNFAYQYYFDLQKIYTIKRQRIYPKSRMIFNTMDKYFKLGKPIKYAIEEIKRELAKWEVLEYRSIYEEYTPGPGTEKIKKLYQEGINEFITDIENVQPVLIDSNLFNDDDITTGNELPLIIGNDDNIKKYSFPENMLDRNAKKEYVELKKEVKCHLQNFQHFKDIDFVYFYTDRKAKDGLFSYVHRHHQSYIKSIQNSGTRENLKTGTKEPENKEFTNYRRTAAIYLMLELFGVDKKANFSQKSVSRFLEFLTGVKEGNLYERVNEIYNQGYKDSHFDDLRYLRKFFVDLQLPEIVEYIDKTTGDK